MRPPLRLLRTTRSLNPRFRVPSLISITPVKVPRRTLLTTSYSKGATPPLLNLTLGDHLALITDQHGDRNAVISHHQNLTLTYRELHEESSELAAGLIRHLGVKKGDIVAVSLGNTAEYVLVEYALYKIGAVLVQLNPAFNEAQIKSALLHLNAQHLIFGTHTKLPRKPARPNLPLLQSLIPTLEKTATGPLIPSLRSVTLVNNAPPDDPTEYHQFRGLTHFDDILTTGIWYRPPTTPPLSPHDIINIQFTSGTTSSPKAAQLTHLGILNNAHSIGARMNLTPTDTICSPPPLFHCFGSVLGLLACISHGSSIVFPAEAFNAEATMDAVARWKCTGLHGVPTMFTACLELLHHNPSLRARWGEKDPETGMSIRERLRTGIAAGSSVPEELMKRIERELGIGELVICYGMTETSPVSCMTRCKEEEEEMRWGSIGKVMDNVEVKVVSKEDPEVVVPVGVRGELAVAGYGVMAGYYGDEAKTEEVVRVGRDGKRWMYTGDEAVMTETGYVKITGRIKDLIIRGGENISPLEVENCLLAHPGVAEVTVAGIPDEKYGEVVGAFVRVCEGTEVVERPVEEAPVTSSGGVSKGAVEVTKEELESGKKMNSDEVRRWVREKLSGHLVPKYVFWVDGYPKTASGKVQRFALRDMAVDWIKEGKGL